jgi:hypothetical protein
VASELDGTLQKIAVHLGLGTPTYYDATTSYEPGSNKQPLSSEGHTVRSFCMPRLSRLITYLAAILSRGMLDRIEF